MMRKGKGTAAKIPEGLPADWAERTAGLTHGKIGEAFGAERLARVPSCVADRRTSSSIGVLKWRHTAARIRRDRWRASMGRHVRLFAPGQQTSRSY
jgi:RNA 3'-terminal phosphate cyclase